MSSSIFKSLAVLSVKMAVISVMIQGPAATAAETTVVPSTQNTTPSTTQPQQVILTPEFLRHQVLEGNLSLEQELNIIKDQKDKMNVARGQLLPSLNLGMLISSGPSFLLSSISFLLPFLFPSNWMALDAATDQFNAEKISYKILEMNVYSSSLSMYYTVLADAKIQKIYEQQAKDLMNIYTIKKMQFDLIGIVTPQDLEQTLASAQLAQVSASQLKELAAQETAALRQVLGLPLATEIEFTAQNMPGSDWENKPIAQAVLQAFSVAPENQQIDFLIAAAKAKDLSADFGFLNTATLSASGSGGSGATLGNLAGGVSFHFGFDYFPNLNLTERSILEIQLQKRQLGLQITQTLESVTKSLVEANRQFSLASQAEVEMTNVYNTIKLNYDLGLTELINVLTAHVQLVQASVARVKAEQDLNQQRVSLHRVMITDQFSLIKGCAIMPKKKHGGLGGLIGGIFGDSDPDKTIDQMCIEGGVRK